MLMELVGVVLVLLLCGGISYLYGVCAHINIVLFPQITELTFSQAVFSRYLITWLWTRYPVAIFIAVAILIPALLVLKVWLKSDD